MELDSLIQNLHSTMLLLYHEVKILHSDKTYNLHSTMLLLYLYHLFQMEQDTRHLHSTMLLLYPIMRGVFFRHSIPFTFHYASTLSQGYGQLAGAIPDLHSTMLLLYPIKRSRDRIKPDIYIPLCFYFIEIAEEAEKARDSIYIPLCFYFITSSYIT